MEQSFVNVFALNSLENMYLLNTHLLPTFLDCSNLTNAINLAFVVITHSMVILSHNNLSK